MSCDSYEDGMTTPGQTRILTAQLLNSGVIVPQPHDPLLKKKCKDEVHPTEHPKIRDTFPHTKVSDDSTLLPCAENSRPCRQLPPTKDKGAFGLSGVVYRTTPQHIETLLQEEPG